MAIFDDIDCGGRPAHFLVSAGINITTPQIAGSDALSWSSGPSGASEDFQGWIEAWQSMGGQPAQSLAALRVLRNQLYELANNQDMQPIMVQVAATLASNPMYASRSDDKDGWYWLSAFTYDPETYNLNGAQQADWTLIPVAPTTAPLSKYWAGGIMPSNFAQVSAGVPQVAFPVGSTDQYSFQLTRPGAEGNVPVTILTAGSLLVPARFSRPGTLAALQTGAVRLYDSMSTSNPVPVQLGAPGLVNSGSGTTLLAGTYTIAIQYQFANNQLGPLSVAGSVIITANQQIAITASSVPAGVVQVNFWVMTAPGGVNTGYIQSVTPTAGSASYTYTLASQGNGTSPATSGPYVHSNWARVYGALHGNVQDLILTNGLLMLRFPVGSNIEVYNWNTSGNAGWYDIGALVYVDNNGTFGSIQSVGIDYVSMDEARLRVEVAAGAADYAILEVKLQAGADHAQIDLYPQNVTPTSSQKLTWVQNRVPKIAYVSATSVITQVVDVVLQTPVSLTNGSYGYSATFATSVNSVLLGFLYQNQPTAQGQFASTANYSYGDTPGIPGWPLNTFRRYGIFATPYANIQNLRADAATGSLGTGWSSVVDGGASSGSAAKVASGTVAGNADLFGVAWQPSTAGNYDAAFRIRVTSAAGSAAELTIGIWDVTAGAFVSGASTTIKANQLQTVYTWISCLPGSTSISLPVGHNLQLRVVTALTLGTDYFIDQAVLLPTHAATAGQGRFPGDIWAQFIHETYTEWVMG